MPSLKIVAASLLLTTISALSHEIEFPESFPLERRQNVSPEQGVCHAACGSIIRQAREEAETYCEDSTYQSNLSNCRECANDFNIWQFYSAGVTRAAEACDDDATPSPSDAVSGEETTATSLPTPSETSVETPSLLPTTASVVTPSSVASSTPTPPPQGLGVALGGSSVYAVAAALGVVANFAV